MTAVVLRGDARDLPLPDASVDLICTSPPFLNLRSYTDNGEHYDGQIGTGARPQFLDDLWDCTAEMTRVLKPTGSIFVELGDSYTDKCLNDTPHRYVIGCVDKLGLILRAEIVWHHTNGLPESVTDRVRRAHSVVFHLVKQPRYYAAVDEIREAHTGGSHGGGVTRMGRTDGLSRDRGYQSEVLALNPLGKLPGSVWDIPSQPLTVPDWLGISHFAAYPMELPRRIILGWSPPGICTVCGEGRRPVVDTSTRAVIQRSPGYQMPRVSPDSKHGTGKSSLGYARDTTITGYACACPDATAPTRPALVVDPFGGTGTTALVASMYGRDGFSFDLSMDYARLAKWRTSDPGERAKALGVPKPPKQADGQGDLFEAVS